jgi:selenocysteine lyase/cysteine desulfurase
MDWSAIRAEFPALERWTYLNTATYGQVPRRAMEALTQHWQRLAEFASCDFLDWYTDADRIRAACARLIHASPEDIAFVPNAAAALSIVIAGLRLQPGDNIVTLDGEFPNYQYMAAARRVRWEELRWAIDARTRLVAFSEVNYSTGFRPPLDEVLRITRERGVPLFLDGSQSVGALRFDVTRTPVDVLAVHGYKWLCSPTGAGFVYVSPGMRRRLPPNIIGWRSHRDWRNVSNLHHGTPTFKDSAEKYEGGGLPFWLLYPMEASVNMILEIGPEVIERRVLDLAASIRSVLTELGAAVTDTGSQIVIARFPDNDAGEIVRALRERNVTAAARHGRLRLSPHFYNNEDDLARLASALRRA